MITEDWLTDAVLYLYALSLLFFVSDAASGNRNAKKMGTGLLVFVWVLQTAFLLTLLVTKLSNPSLLMREYLFFVSWLLVSASFVLNRWMRAELLVLLVNAVGFAVLALNLLERPGTEMPLSSHETAARLLIVHVSLITLAFAILTVAALLAGMYLFLHGSLKRKRWSPLLGRMPSLEVIERYGYRAGLIGVPLLLLSLSTGTAALLLDGPANRLLDEKLLFSFAAAALYVVFLVRRMTASGIGTSLARWNIAGYTLLVVDYFASSMSSFHSWM